MTGTPRRWWQSPFRLLQTNLREDDALLDAGACVDQLVELGYDTWLCNAGGIVYFYPCDGDFQRPARRLHERPSGDLVGDVVAAAQRRAVRVISRFDFSRLPADIVASHASWAFIDRNGEWYTEDGLTAICPRSAYHTEIVPTVLRDFVATYPVDGIFFNWLQFTEVTYRFSYRGPCRCDRCCRAFAAANPRTEHPRGPADDGYDRWVQLALEHLTTLTERYSDVVNGARPNTPLMLADVCRDIAFLETSSSLGHDPAKWWRHTPSELASVSRTAFPEVAALVHSSANVGLPYRQIGEAPAQFRRYVAQALSRGALPSAVVIGTVDEGRTPCVPAAAPLLRFHRAHNELYRHYRSDARVALLRPRGGTAMSAMQSQDDFSEFRGWYTALQEAHVPFDVLGLQFQRDLVAADSIGRYSLLVVPGTRGLDVALAAAIDRYVAGGGAVVVSGEAFVDGVPALAAVPASKLVSRLEGVSALGGRYVGPSDGRVDLPLHPVVGHFDRVEWSDAALAGDLSLSTQSPFGPPEITGGSEPENAAPAVVRAAHGDGSVSYFPWTIGTSAHLSGLTGPAEVMTAEVRRLIGAPPVGAEISSEVEITLGRSKDSIVVHLINHSGGRGDRVRAPLPAQGSLLLSADVAAEVDGARALLAERDLAIVSNRDGSARIALDIHDVLEVVVLG